MTVDDGIGRPWNFRPQEISSQKDWPITTLRAPFLSLSRPSLSVSLLLVLLFVNGLRPTCEVVQNVIPEEDRTLLLLLIFVGALRRGTIRKVSIRCSFASPADRVFYLGEEAV